MPVEYDSTSSKMPGFGQSHAYRSILVICCAFRVLLGIHTCSIVLVTMCDVLGGCMTN